LGWRVSLIGLTASQNHATTAEPFARIPRGTQRTGIDSNKGSESYSRTPERCPGIAACHHKKMRCGKTNEAEERSGNTMVTRLWRADPSKRRISSGRQGEAAVALIRQCLPADAGV